MARVPRYTINLDEPAETRWAHVIEDYKDKVGVVSDYVDTVIKDGDSFMVKLAANIVETVMSVANQTKFVYYHEELKAIAKGAKMPLGRVVMMQLVYEAAALCTSIAVPSHLAQQPPSTLGQPVASPVSEVGVVAHIRTMDWEMDFLRDLTIEVDFTRNGKSLHTITTWAGYVGALTGIAHRPSKLDNFSVSVNFRSKGSGTLWTNIKQALSRGWPIGFLVRETFESATSYDQAVQWLKSSELIAPCYFTVVSARPYTACLITRDRKHDEQFLTVTPPGASPTTPPQPQPQEKLSKLKSSSSSKAAPTTDTAPPQTLPFLVQANIDHWSYESDEDIMDSIRRRRQTQDILRTQGGANGTTAIGHDALWGVVSRQPVCNCITIYGTLMYPSTGFIETRVPLPKTGFAMATNGAATSSSSSHAEQE